MTPGYCFLLTELIHRVRRWIAYLSLWLITLIPSYPGFSARYRCQSRVTLHASIALEGSWSFCATVSTSGRFLVGMGLEYRQRVSKTTNPCITKAQGISVYVSMLLITQLWIRYVS